MTTKEIKNLIREKDAWKEFLTAVSCEDDLADSFKNKTGLVFEFSETEREDGHYYWRFYLDGLLYQITGSYYSQEGPMLDYEYEYFYRVEPKEVTITTYEMVKEDE